MATQLRFLLDRIRAEAKIKGSDTLVGLIIYTLNEVQKEYTGRRRFDQLWKPRQEILPVAAGDTTFVVPLDLQVLQKDGFQFSLSGNYDEAYDLFWQGPVRGTSDGSPWSITRTGEFFNLWPFSDITVDSRLYINYWRFPNDLIVPNSMMEIPELEPVVLKETIARISRQGSSDVLNSYIKEAQRSYGASFGVDAQR